MCSNCPDRMTNMATRLEYGEKKNNNLKNPLFQNHLTDRLKTWYVASGTRSSNAKVVQMLTLVSQYLRQCQILKNARIWDLVESSEIFKNKILKNLVLQNCQAQML